MILKSDSWPRIFRWVFLILLYYVACLVVLNTYMDRHGFRGYEDRYGFAKMTDYTAEKPFSYRVLTPLVVNGIMELIPDRSFVKLEKDLLHDSEFLRYADTTGEWGVKISARQHLSGIFGQIQVVG